MFSSYLKFSLYYCIVLHFSVSNKIFIFKISETSHRQLISDPELAQDPGADQEHG